MSGKKPNNKTRDRAIDDARVFRLAEELQEWFTVKDSFSYNQARSTLGRPINRKNFDKLVQYNFLVRDKTKIEGNMYALNSHLPNEKRKLLGLPLSPDEDEDNLTESKVSYEEHEDMYEESEE